MAATKAILTSFDMKGRAEPIRLAMAIGGIEFEDKRVCYEDFPKLKPTLPYGQLPVLQIDGEELCQTLTILYYVGMKAKLCPEDTLGTTRLGEACISLVSMVDKIVSSIKETDPSLKAKMREKLAKDTIPTFLKHFESHIGKVAKNGHCVGEKMTVADLLCFSLVDWLQSGILDGIPKDIVDKYPNVNKVVKNVIEHPKVKEWYSVKHGSVPARN